MLDLENREVLIQYLLEKGVIHSDIPYEVNYCRGGVSCIAALIETEGKTMLVKQGRAKLAVKEDWHADPARMKIEAIANDFYNKCIPQSAPAVLFYDEENCIMVRDAAPASCRMWKEDLLSGIFDFEVVQKTMRRWPSSTIRAPIAPRPPRPLPTRISSTSCASPPILSSWPASTLSTRLRSKR